MDFRSEVLKRFGAAALEAAELLRYNQNVFNHDRLPRPLNLPLPDEPFAAAWAEYAAEALNMGVLEALKPRLVQLWFPIREGISQNEHYRAATLRGVSPQGLVEASGLVIKKPERLRLIVPQTLGGRVPLLITGHRDDFVSLVRALSLKNEPAPVPEAEGACIVSGYNNWDRVRRLKADWTARNPSPLDEYLWAEEFQRIIPHKELYQDRFIILSDGLYSGVAAAEVGLAADEWRELSLIIRREHECTHYFTRRVFGSMRNNLIDELIADYVGLIAAVGRFKAEMFLRFIGLEDYPRFRKGGRLEIYRGDPPLSAGAFRVLQSLIKEAAHNLERFAEERAEEIRGPKGQTLMIMTLTSLTLEELASAEALALIGGVLTELGRGRRLVFK